MTNSHRNKIFRTSKQRRQMTPQAGVSESGYITSSQGPTTSTTQVSQTTTSQSKEVKVSLTEVGKSLVSKASPLPADSNWKGDYGFDVYFQPQEKASKSVSWTYSEMKDKLFVNASVACPISFYTTSPPPSGCIIRAMAVFSRPEHRPKPVKRCLNHSSPTDPSNDGHPAPTHLIRCGNPQSQYLTDPVSNRDSVTTPYLSPHVGTDCTTYLYMFMCLGSCVGGLDRKPLQIIFTLEKDGKILGRRKIEVKICACPGRDRRIDEQTLAKRSLNENNKGLENTCDSTLFASTQKRLKTSQDEEVFTIAIRGRKNFEILQKIRNAFELAKLISPEQAAVLKNRREY